MHYLLSDKMSNIDSELYLLRQKIEMLEKQKQIQKALEDEKMANPLATLGQIIEENKKKITRYDDYGDPTKLHLSAKFHYEEKVTMMEPIFIMLKDIQQRLEVLEQGKS